MHADEWIVYSTRVRLTGPSMGGRCGRNQSPLISSMSLPRNPLQVVDISAIDKHTAQQLLDAATAQGFLFVEGHGFSAQEVHQLFQLSKAFFELPTHCKQLVPIDESNHGYTNFGGENLDPSLQHNGDPKEALNFCAWNFMKGKSEKTIHGWFHEQPERAELVEKMAVKLYQLSIKILRILALALNIEDLAGVAGGEWFTSRYAPEAPSGTTFRFLHYPGQKRLHPEATVRAGAHTDYGSMTLLFQQENQEGLEIFSPISKKWEAVPYVAASAGREEAAPIVVNIADQLSYWTGGLLKSTIHRVKFPPHVQESGQDRYSIVFFSHPNDLTLLEPVPSEIIRNILGRGANNELLPITAGEHLRRRLAATYGWK